MNNQNPFPRSIYRILVVDDEKQIVNLIVRVLKKFYPETSIEVAYNGYDAICKIIRFHPHLITLDINIPEVDGLTVCRNVKSNTDTQNIKVVVISGENDKHISSRIYNHGADKFISKPFTVEELKTTLDNILK